MKKALLTLCVLMTVVNARGAAPATDFQGRYVQETEQSHTNMITVSPYTAGSSDYFVGIEMLLLERDGEVTDLCTFQNHMTAVGTKLVYRQRGCSVVIKKDAEGALIVHDHGCSRLMCGSRSSLVGTGATFKRVGASAPMGVSDADSGTDAKE